MAERLRCAVCRRACSRGRLLSRALWQVLASNEVYLMPKPELYASQAPQKFDAAGRLTDDTVRQSARGLVAALATWARRLRVA